MKNYFIVIFIIINILILEKSVAEQPFVYKCNHVNSIITENDTIKKYNGPMSKTIYFAFTESGMLQTFTANKNDPADIAVGKGYDGNIYNYKSKSIEATRIKNDAIYHWRVDISAKTVDFYAMFMPMQENVTSMRQFFKCEINN